MHKLQLTLTMSLMLNLKSFKNHLMTRDLSSSTSMSGKVSELIDTVEGFDQIKFGKQNTLRGNVKSKNKKVPQLKIKLMISRQHLSEPISKAFENQGKK